MFTAFNIILIIAVIWMVFIIIHKNQKIAKLAASYKLNTDAKTVANDTIKSLQLERTKTNSELSKCVRENERLDKHNNLLNTAVEFKMSVKDAQQYLDKHEKEQAERSARIQREVQDELKKRQEMERFTKQLVDKRKGRSSSSSSPSGSRSSSTNYDSYDSGSSSSSSSNDYSGGGGSFGGGGSGGDW